MLSIMTKAGNEPKSVWEKRVKKSYCFKFYRAKESNKFLFTRVKF